MGSFAAYVGGVIAILAGGYRWRPGATVDVGSLALSIALVAIGVSALLSAPTTITALAPVEPAHHAVRLVANLAAVSAAAAVRVLSAVIAREHVAGIVLRHGLGAALAALLMTSCVAMMDCPSQADFVARCGTELPVVGYIVVFSAYIASGMIAFNCRLGVRLRACDRPWLARGLRIIRVGIGFGSVWAVAKIVAVTWVYATGQVLLIETWVAAMSAAACVALVGIGATVPTWGPWAAAPLHRLRLRHVHRRLVPLRDVLRGGNPGDHAPHDDVDIETRVTILVVEIEDALLAIAPDRPLYSCSPRDAAEHITDTIDSSKTDFGRHRLMTENTAPWADLTGEIKWLTKVASEFGRIRRSGRPSR